MEWHDIKRAQGFTVGPPPPPAWLCGPGPSAKEEISTLQEINADLLSACEGALAAFENNLNFDWTILSKAIEKAKAAR